MPADKSNLIRRLARGVAAVRATTGSERLAESLPVAIGDGVAKPVVERRRKRGDGSERFTLILPFGEGDVRIDLKPAEFEALTREMVRFWNEQAGKGE